LDRIAKALFPIKKKPLPLQGFHTTPSRCWELAYSLIFVARDTIFILAPALLKAPKLE
jgi:hypothetical protein